MGGDRRRIEVDRGDRARLRHRHRRHRGRADAAPASRVELRHEPAPGRAARARRAAAAAVPRRRSSGPASTGRRSTASASASAPARSPGCASASRPAARSRSPPGRSVAAVSTLRALAGATSTARSPVIDARRGEVFVLVGGEPRRRRGPRSSPRWPAGGPRSGDGALLYADRLGGRSRRSPSSTTSAAPRCARWRRTPSRSAATSCSRTTFATRTRNRAA